MNRLYLSKLFDYYKNLLTQNEQNIFNEYYNEDLSLQEIADNLNISKSAVGKTLKIVEKKLEDYEQKLGLNLKNKKINKLLINKIDENLLNLVNEII